MNAPAAVRVPGAQGSIAWLDNRRDVIGSSDIPIVTGSSPYKTSLLTAWAHKTRLLDPEPPDAEDQEMFDLGHALEGVIADRYALHPSGGPVRRVNDLLRHPTVPWMGASLDRRRVGQRRVVECKWLAHRRWSGDANDPVPGYVQDQVQWQLAVTGWDVADVAVLNGSHVEVYTIETDRGYQDDLQAIAYQKLWRFVEAREMPAVDGSDSTRQTLARLATRRALVNGTHIRATPDLELMAYLLRDDQVKEKLAHAAVGTTKNAIGALLLAADASGVDGEGWRIDWHRNADSVKEVRDDAAIAALYRKLLEAALEQQDPTVRGALRDNGFDPDAPDLLDVLEGIHTNTETKEGARPMRLWTKGEDGRWT